MHHVDTGTPWDEIWQAMEVLVAQGKILYTGSSNFAGWHIAQACDAARARGFVGLVSEQSLYNLATRWIELEVLPAARAYGVGVIPWSPLEGGLLGGVLSAEREGRRRLAGRAKALVEAHRERIEAWEELCAKLGEEPAHVALAWLLHQDGVTAPIIGPRTREQLDSAQRALDIRLGGDVLTQLDDIFPGYKTAPEHYAW
jgi:aryl-alcohol dehydrogenase-like predicted oxidoreductase